MTRFELAKAHAKNRKKILKAITQLNRSLNQAIKDNKTELQDANIRSILILYAAYLEASLRYIAYFYGAQIPPKVKDNVLSQSSEIDKWAYLIDYLFRKRFLEGKSRAFNLINLGHTNFHRYNYIDELLGNEIRSIIEMRNKLAHGQWAIAFTSDGDETNQEVTTKMWTLEKKDVLATKNITNGFISVVEKLAASDIHFKEEFDDVVHKLEWTKQEHEKRYLWLMKELKRRK